MPITFEQIMELQSKADMPPPAPPKKTAQATDDSEKRPCKYCGHTQAEHLGPRCRGVISSMDFTSVSTYAMPGSELTHQVPTLASTQCACIVYQPKED